MLCGKRIYNWVQAIASKNFVWDTSGEKDTYGIRINRFQMGAYNVKIVRHDLFDQGSLRQQALLFNTGDLALMYKNTGELKDLSVKENIQTNASHTKADEIRGTVGLKCWSGGANVTRIINWVTQ
jgi:hypothetical protein